VDTEKCEIYDLSIVSQDTLLVCKGSFLQWKVELVSSQTGKVLSQLELKGQPWRVNLVGRNKAAVTLSGQMVYLIKIKRNTLVEDKVLKASGEVFGITKSGDNLVVTYREQPLLEMISMTGKVLRRFHSTEKSQHFELPDFITTSPDGTLWISDCGNNTITKMDAGLNILQTFTSQLLADPCGISAVTEDQVLVCSAGNNSLVLLQPSTNTMSTLLGKDDGMEHSFSLTYCPQKRTLFVASYWADSIKVFRFT